MRARLFFFCLFVEKQKKKKKEKEKNEAFFVAFAANRSQIFDRFRDFYDFLPPSILLSLSEQGQSNKLQPRFNEQVI